MPTFHDHYGVPTRYPAPYTVSPELHAHLERLSPRMRVYLLTQAARDDFHENFPVIGEFGGLRGRGGSDRAWALHGQSYIMAAWESYFASGVALIDAANVMEAA